jgi:hypothetical protein
MLYLEPGVAVYTGNPSYLGDGDRRLKFKATLGKKKLSRLYLSKQVKCGGAYLQSQLL